MPIDDVNLKVLKKFSPHQPGARKLAQKYGESLVCVRHRTDANGQFRYTTVELLVGKTAVQPRSERVVSLRINHSETRLRTVVCAAGPYVKLVAPAIAKVVLKKKYVQAPGA